MSVCKGVVAGVACAMIAMGAANRSSVTENQQVLKNLNYPQAKLDSVSRVGVFDFFSPTPFEIQRKKLNNAAREFSTARVLDSLKIDPAVQKKILATITKFN